MNELINRDKATSTSSGSKTSLEDSDNLPDPDILTQEFVEDLETALEQFHEIAADLGGDTTKRSKGFKDNQNASHCLRTLKNLSTESQHNQEEK